MLNAPSVKSTSVHNHHLTSTVIVTVNWSTTANSVENVSHSRADLTNTWWCILTRNLPAPRRAVTENLKVYGTSIVTWTPILREDGITVIIVITRTKTNGIQIHIWELTALKKSTIMNVTSVAKRCRLVRSLNATGSKVVTFSRWTHYMWKLHGVGPLLVVFWFVVHFLHRETL